MDEALDEFERERTLAEPHRLYGREYSMYALLGRGSALFRSGRRDEAADAFRGALARYPEHPLALIGAAVATDGSFARAEAAIAAMTDGKPVQAGIARGALLAAAGDAPAAAAALDAVLAAAPPGFAGWQIPVLPMFRQVAETTHLKAVFEHLSERAR